MGAGLLWASPKQATVIILTDEMMTSTTDADDEADIRAVSQAIQSRLASVRRAKGQSFDQLAGVSGISKGMLVQIEQGKANPSIAILCRLASALGLSVASLIQVSDASPVAVSAADAAKRLWTGPAGGSATLLAGSQGPDMLELWEWELRPGERFEGDAHSRGTQELLRVVEGALELNLDGARHVVEAGASISAFTDRPHAYVCLGQAPVRFTMVVFEPGGAAGALRGGAV
jgi:transcriptional regulator with XRE-family HTH domain